MTMPVGKGNNKSKDDFGSVTPPTLKGRKAVAQKLYSPVQIEASPDQEQPYLCQRQMNTKVLFLWSTLKQSSCFTLEITTCLVGFYNKTCM